MPDEINNLNDAELVAKALKNPDDYAAIVYRYQQQIRRYVIRLGCKDGNDADDLLQDIFLKVYLNLNDFDSALKFSSWLYRIAHNETISYFRKNNVRPQPVTTEEETRIFENLADDEDMAKVINDKMDAAIMKNALNELDDQYRDVLTLKFLEEKNYTEISDILRIPTGTVGTLISRGKKKLEAVLKDSKLIK